MYPTVANKVPHKAVVNLYLTKCSRQPNQEYHCVNISIKSWNNDSVVSDCAFGPTFITAKIGKYWTGNIKHRTISLYYKQGYQ